MDNLQNRIQDARRRVVSDNGREERLFTPMLSVNSGDFKSDGSQIAAYVMDGSQYKDRLKMQQALYNHIEYNYYFKDIVGSGSDKDL